MVWIQFLGLWAFAGTQSKGNEMVSAQNIDSWFRQHEGLNITLSLILFVLTVVLFVLYFYSRAGIAASVNDLIERKPVGFIKGLVRSKTSFWPVFNVWLISLLAFALVLAVLGAPVLYLAAMNFGFRAILLGMLALLILVPVLLLIEFINVFSVLFATLYRLNLWSSIRASFDLVSRFWPQLTLLALILFLINLAVFFAGIFLIFLIGAPVVLLQGLPYHIWGVSLELAAAVVAAIIGLVLFFLTQAVASGYSKTVWVLAFLELSKPKKSLELEEPVILPEVIT